MIDLIKKYFLNSSVLCVGGIILICFLGLYTDKGISLEDKKVNAQDLYFITESGSSGSSNSSNAIINTDSSNPYEISDILNSSSRIASIDVVEKKFSSFKQFKLEVVELISKARSRVYVSTEFFGDGDLASSLFIAKFRKIDIMVLVNPMFSYKAFSRVGFFQDNGIEVYSRDKNFHTKYRTIIIVDNTLYGINIDLYDNKNNQEISLMSFNKTNLSSVIEQFNLNKNNSMKNKNKLKRPSLPQVKNSTSNRSSSYYSNTNSNSNVNPGVSITNPSEVYNYDKYPKQNHIPQGISSTLPKELKSKNK